MQSEGSVHPRRLTPGRKAETNPEMIRIVAIGAGAHSRENHLPALARYNREHPGVISLAALCDLCPDRAESMSRQFGFHHWYTDIDQMLDRESPDACIAVTPVPKTAEIVLPRLDANLPLLMEKPPGATLEQAAAINEKATLSGLPVMVSMNRRFAPVIAFARSALNGRRLESISGSMLRTGRVEPEFFYGTGIHAIDTMRHLAGDLASHSARSKSVQGVRWYSVEMDFVGGARGHLEVQPTCGCVSERYELRGDDFRILARFMGDDSGTVTVWEGGRAETTNLQADPSLSFVENGTYAETAAFITAIRENRPPHPSPESVLQSVEVCATILENAADD